MACNSHLEVGNIGLEEHKSFDVFSTEVSSAVRVRVTSRAEKTFNYSYSLHDAIRQNMNRLFGPLFGTEANTNRIFGTSLVKSTSNCIFSTQEDEKNFLHRGTDSTPSPLPSTSPLGTTSGLQTLLPLFVPIGKEKLAPMTKKWCKSMEQKQLHVWQHGGQTR